MSILVISDCCGSQGKEVAIKVLPKVRGKLSREKTLEKLAREVDILERLQGCGGVIHLEDVFEDADNVSIVTELCAGGDLQQYAEVGPYTRGTDPLAGHASSLQHGQAILQPVCLSCCACRPMGVSARRHWRRWPLKSSR